MYNYYDHVTEMPPREVMDATSGMFFFTVFFTILIAAMVIYIVAIAKIFKKAGKPGWAAIVPFYNSYVLSEVAWGNGLYFLASFIPVLNGIFPIFLTIKLGRAFRKSDGFIVGMVFLPFIFMPMLAFGDSRYFGPDDLFDILPKSGNGTCGQQNGYTQQYGYYQGQQPAYQQPQQNYPSQPGPVNVPPYQPGQNDNSSNPQV